MKHLLTVVFLLSLTGGVVAQQSDFIVVKKHNNKTLKTYSEGSFITAETFNGFRLNGYISAIRNDSIIVKQHITTLVNTDFGQKLDTVVFTVGINYSEIKKFEFKAGDLAGRKKGFLEVTGPKILMIGGVGYIVLELVNTAYRGDNLSDGNTLTNIAIAGAVAVTGFLWNHIANSRDRVGGKYKVVYVKAGALTGG